jgi:hypothetical protein
VAARVQREGLRAVALDLHVSHETVRTVVKRVGLLGSGGVGERLVLPSIAVADLLERNGPET